MALQMMLAADDTVGWQLNGNGFPHLIFSTSLELFIVVGMQCLVLSQMFSRLAASDDPLQRQKGVLRQEQEKKHFLINTRDCSHLLNDEM
jgi:hypothetical protein